MLSKEPGDFEQEVCSKKYQENPLFSFIMYTYKVIL